MNQGKTLNFNTSQEAWEGLNEYFLFNEDDIVKRGGHRSGGQLIAFDVMLKIGLLRVDPEFDFNRMFNYQMQKWSSLVGNYVNLNYLDLVRNEVRRRESKKGGMYNISYLFDNTHQSGKGCLLSLTFARRSTFPDPILIVTLRSSEIVKRLNFDFLF